MRRRHVQRMVFSLIAFVWAVFTVSQNAWCDNNDNNYVCIWPTGMQYFPAVGVTQGCLALENVPTAMSPGQWVQVKANGGTDCDNIIGGLGGACGSSTCQPTYTCVHGMRNDYKPYTWTVTGYVDHVIPHSGTYTGVLEEYCDVEALPEWSNGTIEVKIEREEATTASDPWTTNTLCASPSDHATIAVTKPTPKMRSVEYNPLVSPSTYVSAFSAWSTDARTDGDHLPGWYNPYGGTADNHECVEFQASVVASDVNVPLEVVYPTVSPYYPADFDKNVLVVSHLWKSTNHSDGEYNGYGDCPGRKVVLSNISTNKIKTLGHEWGHNGGEDDICVDYDVMVAAMDSCYVTPQYGTNIGIERVGAWAVQEAYDLPD